MSNKLKMMLIQCYLPPKQIQISIVRLIHIENPY